MEGGEGRFQLRNGKCIASEELSRKMFYIQRARPELAWQADSTGYAWDESGLADLFSECYRNDARYCPEAKSWYTYAEGRWQKDVGALLVAGKIKEFIRLMDLYCGEIEDEATREPYRKFVAKAGDRRFRDRLMKDAADCMLIPASAFDRHPYLVNCRNGTCDLTDGSFREHSWEDFLTMQTAFDYTVQKVRCPRWERFIDEVTEGDREKADYLQRALGYSILGTGREECMFILHGKSTRNGKSTLLDALQHLLGDYAAVAPVELICRSDRVRNAEAANPVLARLKGRRMVTMAESDRSGRLDEAVIKQYTGGEEITARELYQAPISFKPQFTLWLSCNDLPAVRDKSLFASERVRVIEFNRHFSDAEQDKSLKDYFAEPEAMQGIFAWLAEGCRKYQERGLAMPDSLRAPVRQYERDNDLVLQFLEEFCERAPDASLKAKALYDSYKLWCRTSGYYTASAKKFNAELSAHPEWYDHKGTSRGVAVYYGIRLREIL